MAGNTYKWVGNNGGTADPNTAFAVANWQVFELLGFVPAVNLPAGGDIVEFPAGTADILPGGSADVQNIAFDFTGPGATVNLANVSIDNASTITALTGSTGTLGILGAVTNQATITASGAGATIDVALSAAFQLQSVALAVSGGSFDVTQQGTAGTLANDGGIVGFGGNVNIAAPISGFGLLVSGSGTMSLGSFVSGAQAVIFADAAATLTIGDPGQFKARLLGFQTGDTIDLPTIKFSSESLAVNGSVLTVSSAGSAASLSFNGMSLDSTPSVQFGTAPDSQGGTLLTILNTTNAEWTTPASGSWGTGAAWSTGSAPGIATTAQITALGGSAFTVTADGFDAANSLILLAPQGTLDVTGTLSLARAAFQAVGEFDIAANGTLTAKTFNQLTGGATLNMAAGAAMQLSGSTSGSTVTANGNPGLDIEGEATLTGSSLTVFDSSARIGYFGDGTLDATAGSNVSASFTDVGGAANGSGTLVIDASNWTDTGIDTTAAFPGYMIVGGGEATAGGFAAGGNGTLEVQNGASLHDTGGAIIAQSMFSTGTASVSGGAIWQVDGNLTDGGTGSDFALLQVSGGTLTVGGTLSGNGSIDIGQQGSVTVASADLTGGTATIDSSQFHVQGLLTVSNAGIAVTGSSAVFAGSAALSGGMTTIDQAQVQVQGALSDFGGFTVQDHGNVAVEGNAAFNGGSPGLLLQSGGVLQVNGNLSAGNGPEQPGNLIMTGGFLNSQGTLTVDGALALGGGSNAQVQSLVIGSGSVNVDPSSSMQVGFGPAPAQGQLLIEPGGTMSLGGGSVFNGTLDVEGLLQTGNATIDQALTGNGTIDIASFSTLTILGAAQSWTAAIVFGADGNGDLAISGPAGNDQGLIEGLGTIANTIDLPGVTYNQAMPLAYNANSGALTLGMSGSFQVGAQFTLEPGQPLQYHTAPDGGSGTAIVLSLACYVSGTAIATPAGAVAVESLRPGDKVLVQRDGAWSAEPVRWVGRFSVDLARHPAPVQAAPIRIAAGAIAAGVPCRDLLVSPDHAIQLGGVLVQAQALVNGASIRQEPAAGTVTYHHIELDRHGILLAEGLPAESYLDTGNRGQFDAEAGIRPLFPDLATPRAWSADACAPLLLDGPVLAQQHADLLARAATLGHVRTADPGLVVLADGVAVPLIGHEDGIWQAILPAGTAAVRLCSRWFVPDAFDRTAGDRRRLGIAVHALRYAGAALPGSAFGPGWYPPEAAWRWTDGDARLSLPPVDGTALLEIRIVRAGPDYWLAAA